MDRDGFGAARIGDETINGRLFLRRRAVPIPALEVTATTSGAAQTWFTAAGTSLNVVTELAQMVATNHTGSAATLSVHFVPSGGAIGDGNKEIDAITVPANSTIRLDRLTGGAYAAGTTCKVYSGTNGAIVISGHLIEQRG